MHFPMVSEKGLVDTRCVAHCSTSMSMKIMHPDVRSAVWYASHDWYCYPNASSDVVVYEGRAARHTYYMSDVDVTASGATQV